MFNYENSGTYLAMAMLATFAASMVSVIRLVRPRNDQTANMSKKNIVKVVAGTYLSLYIAMTPTSLILSAGSDCDSKPQPAPIDVAVSHFGLKSDQLYPLQFGSRFSGTSDDVSASSGLFYASSQGSWNLATGPSIGFTGEAGANWVLETPTSSITFLQQTDAEPSVVVHIGGNETVQGFTMVDNSEPCHLEIRMGWWVFDRPTQERQLVVAEQAQPRWTFATDLAGVS